MDNTKEYIVCAAILRVKPKNLKFYRNVKPNIQDMEIGYRHGDIIHRFNVSAKGKILKRPIVSKSPKAQGFMTSKGRFVDRKEAGKIAFECGQIDKENDYLFSEDIY